jgi:hypothetical protein
MTISPAARASIDALFEQTMRDCCRLDEGDQCTVIQRESPRDSRNDAGMKHVASCSISAYGFRIVALYEFTDDAATARFLRRKFRIAETEPGNGFLSDACAEFINMSVGAAKGVLATAVPILGMSTPFFLGHRGRRHLASLKPAHCRSLDVLVGDDCRFEISYCVCVGRNSSVDFSIDARPREFETAGEMELF